MFKLPILHNKIIFQLPILFMLATLPGLAHAATPTSIMVTPHGQTLQLLPFLDYYIDESLTNDIEEIAILGQTKAFHPLALDKLPAEEGITWLRFVLAPKHPDLRGDTYLLDMGQSIPGRPMLFVPIHNELSGAMEWRESAPGQRNILLLPASGSEPLTCYIRLEGLPGPWFDPVIRSPQNAATNWGSLFHTGAILSLAVVMLLCLLRGLNENGQWRIWTALFVGLALAQAILGMPAISDAFSIKRVAACLAPGLALMTIPHVGRHVLNTGQFSRNIDIQLLILSLAGAALALAPLIPGFAWLERWVDLWPAATLLFVPTAICAWIMGLAGARAFLLACLIPPIFTALAWYGLDFGLPANLLAAAPLCGAALGALVLVTARMPSQQTKNAAEKKKKSGKKSVTQPLNIQPFKEDEIINLDNPLGDSNLRIITFFPEEVEEPARQPLAEELQTAPLKARPGKETAIRLELDDLLRESAGLGQCALPPASKIHADKIICAAQNIGKIISDPDFRGKDSQTNALEENFNLQKLLREVHDAIAPVAEHAGLSLSWYMPPFLKQEYRGNHQQLAETLRLLLDSSIRGCNGGQIKLSVRHVPESPDPGHLFFTVSDTGKGAPPLNRSSVALARTWELAAKYNGYLAMESGPEGLSIAFSMHLPVTEDEGEISKEEISENDAPIQSPRALLAGPDTPERNELAKIIAEIPLRVSEASSMDEALALQRADPANLLVALDPRVESKTADLVAEFVRIAKNAGFDEVHILAITPDESQWRILKINGFTHAMLEPLESATFKDTVIQLASMPRASEKTQTSAEGGSENQDESQNASEENIIDLMDTFYSATSRIIKQKQDAPTLAPEAPIMAEAVEEPPRQQEQLDQATPVLQEEISPQMLAEQDLDMESSFEGPEWLMKIHGLKKNPGSRKWQDEIPRTSQDERTGDATNTASPSELNISAESANVGDFFEEWVGEPMPVASPKARSVDDKPKIGAMESSDGTDVERVGFQPAETPTESSGQFPEDELAGDTSAENESVMDFIISVTPRPVNESGNVENLAAKKIAPETGPGNQAPTSRSQDPIINAFLDKLDAGIAAAQRAYVNGDCLTIEETTALMTQQAESFSCRIIARLAACVERAAKAKDLAALGDLLPVLADAVERNRIASTAGGPEN